MWKLVHPKGFSIQCREPRVETRNWSEAGVHVDPTRALEPCCSGSGPRAVASSGPGAAGEPLEAALMQDLVGIEYRFRFDRGG